MGGPAPAAFVTPAPPERWRGPEELVSLAFGRSRVVMMNEAHNGLLRSVRTRLLGQRIMPPAHEAGSRHFAMEALIPGVPQTFVPAGGYLAQPEMRGLIDAAIDLGWNLIAYEADHARLRDLDPGLEATNRREEEQARTLAAAVVALPSDERVLVWCGNHHLLKQEVGEWRPMALRFWELSGIEPFAIDQTPTVEFEGRERDATRWVHAYRSVIDSHGGAAGFLSEEAPPSWPTAGIDAFVLATENELT